MADKKLLAKARRKAMRRNKKEAARERLHKRRLKLDTIEAKTRQKLRNIESLQAILAERYNSLVYALSQE